MCLCSSPCSCHVSTLFLYVSFYSPAAFAAFLFLVVFVAAKIKLSFHKDIFIPAHELRDFAIVLNASLTHLIFLAGVLCFTFFALERHESFFRNLLTFVIALHGIAFFCLYSLLNVEVRLAWAGSTLFKRSSKTVRWTSSPQRVPKQETAGIASEESGDNTEDVSGQRKSIVYETPAEEPTYQNAHAETSGVARRWRNSMSQRLSGMMHRWAGARRGANNAVTVDSEMQMVHIERSTSGNTLLAGLNNAPNNHTTQQVGDEAMYDDVKVDLSRSRENLACSPGYVNVDRPTAVDDPSGWEHLVEILSSGIGCSLNSTALLFYLNPLLPSGCYLKAIIVACSQDFGLNFGSAKLIQSSLWSSKVLRADGRLVNMSGVFLYKQCTSSLPLFQRNTNKQTIVCWNSFGQQCNSALLQSNGTIWLKKGTVALLPETVSTYDRLLVSVTLEKREGACALFVQKNSRLHYDRLKFSICKISAVICTHRGSDVEVERKTTWNCLPSFLPLKASFEMCRRNEMLCIHLLINRQPWIKGRPFIHQHYN